MFYQTKAAMLLTAWAVLFLLSSLQKTAAQSKVQGIITANKQPANNASVLLLKATDSTLVKGAITGDKGQYLFTGIAQGDYLIAASYTGFSGVYSPVFHLAEKVDLSLTTLQLTQKEDGLTAVIVSAKKPLFEQKIDRMVINVAASITNAGSTALDVLMRSPGIVVDQQNNSLSMNGKDGVIVMMNGKISRMPITAVVQMLAGMSASNIEKIELITTPPANFDAEGNAGFINIVMKVNEQLGTNGSFSVTAGYGQKPLAGASINFNHRSGRWNLFGDYSFTSTGIKNNFSFYRKVAQGSKILETNAGTDRDALITDHNGRLGLDVELTKKTTVGVLFSAFSNTYSMNSINTSYISINSRLDTTISIANSEEHPITNFSSNLNFSHDFSAADKLVLNADYVRFKDANNVVYDNQYFNGTGVFLRNELTRSFKNTPINFKVASADYTKKWSEKVSTEAGVKATVSRFTNDVRVERAQQANWNIDPGLTSINFLKESIYAAYGSLSAQVSKTIAAKLGLRYEYTNSNLESQTVKNIVDRHYGNLFPTLFVSNTINESHSVNFAYSRRITRPTFNDMAPFVYFVDPNTLFSGNPALQPSISNSVKTDYIVKRLIFSLTYTFEKAPITNFAPRVDPVTNKQTLAAENQKNKKDVSLNVSLPVKVNEWWTMQNNLSGTWQELNAIYKSTPIQITQKSFNINTTQSFSLPKMYTIEVRSYFQSGGLFGIYQMKPFGSMDLGLQKKFSDNKSNLRFNISDVFGAPRFRPSVNLPEQNLVVDASLKFSNTYYRLTFTRSFGNSKVKEKRERTTASEEEKQRVNTN